MSKYADGTELASVRLAHLERGKTLHLSEKRIRRDIPTGLCRVTKWMSALRLLHGFITAREETARP